jgi:hypothetical protein
MPNESKTPETDAAKITNLDAFDRQIPVVPIYFARQLELSRDEWRKLAEELLTEEAKRSGLLQKKEGK